MNKENFSLKSLKVHGFTVEVDSTNEIVAVNYFNDEGEAVRENIDDLLSKNKEVGEEVIRLTKGVKNGN